MYIEQLSAGVAIWIVTIRAVYRLKDCTQAREARNVINIDEITIFFDWICNSWLWISSIATELVVGLVIRLVSIIFDLVDSLREFIPLLSRQSKSASNILKLSINEILQLLSACLHGISTSFVIFFLGHRVCAWLKVYTYKNNTIIYQLTDMSQNKFL